MNLSSNTDQAADCSCCGQVKEMLGPFGALQAFNLVMDKNTGNSKVSLAAADLSTCCVPIAIPSDCAI